MGSQRLSSLAIAEHVARQASTDNVDVLIDASPKYRRMREGFAFVHPEVTFLDAKHNVFLHTRRNDDTIVVQNQAILLEQL